MKGRGKKVDIALLSAFLAVFIPAALIGVLAVGMVADQRAARADEIRAALERRLAAALRRLEASLAGQSRDVAAAVSGRFTPASDRAAFLQGLKEIFVRERGVSYPFLLAANGSMVIPAFAGSGAAGRSEWMDKWNPPVADPLWRQAETAEFSRHDPMSAIPLYLKLEGRLPPRMLPDLYLAVARCYAKAGKIVQAREYSQAALRLLTSEPRADRLDLHALRQLGQASMRLGQPQEAFSHYLKLYEALAASEAGLPPDLQLLRWEALDFLRNNRDVQPFLPRERSAEIDDQVLEFYRGEIPLFVDWDAGASTSRPQRSDRDRFLKIKELFDPEESDTLFYRRIARELSGKRLLAAEGLVQYHSGVFQDFPFILATARFNDRRDAAPFFFGFRLQIEEVLQRDWPRLVASLDLPGSASLALASPERTLLAPGATPAGATLASAAGQGALAGWSLNLQSEDRNLLAAAASRSLRWYHALIVALFVSLGLGTLLLLHTLGNERRLLRQKAMFVDAASHALKTPLTRLRLLAEKLEQGWTADPRRRADECRAIADEANGMAQLVDRMLGLSALRSGQPSLQCAWHDVAAWLSDVLRKFNLLLEEKGMALELEIGAAPARAFFDGEALATAVSSLVENALRHAGDGNYLGVTAAARGPNLEITVSDHGPGIVCEEREKLFEPFTLGRAGSGGSGLGLAICRQVVEAHRGGLRVEDNEPSGARFVIVLPLALGAKWR